MDKYESTFRIHYQMLQHMIRQAGLADLPSIHKQKPDFTPSLAVLDDAQALMGREWNSNEPGKEIPSQYTTPCGHLTMNQPRQDCMGICTTLDITSEPNIQAMPRRHVDQTKLQQTLDTSEQRAGVDQPSAAALD